MSSTDTTTNPIIKLGRVLKPSNSKSEDRPELARSSTHEKEARHAAEKQREQARQEAKKEMIEHEKHEIQRRRQIADEKAQLEEDPETRASYGDLNELEEITPFEEVIDMPAGTKVNVRSRIHQQRDLSSRLNFILLRQRGFVIQGVLSEHASEHMIKWVQHLPHEAIVQVSGTLREPPKPITAAVDTPLELDIERLYLVETSHDIPFNLAHGDRPPQSTRLRNRTLDLRHPTTQAIFKIRAKVLKVFRDTLDDLGFLEINTPKLQPSATESGAEVFRVNYFGRKAFLAQSPQLMKQMAISADFRRVYEIGPVFRAENSNTHRHLTEYTGLDIEMTIQQEYYEVFRVLDIVLRNIFKAIKSMKLELDRVREFFPSDDFQLPEETPIIPFHEAVQMLRDDGRDVEEEDFSTPDEIRLGELIKEKLGTDYYVIDKFPVSARPFYTANDGKITNSFDMFIRGQEICTGGQRINDPKKLRESMEESGINEDEMAEYLQAFDWGMPPHGGAGLGVERIVTFFLNLPDVRLSTLWHRDPHSLPTKPPSLPHGDADTLKKIDPNDPPPVENLIANYGDATNTSWLDDRFDIWRDRETGAAIGYSTKNNKFCMITGDPLCDDGQKKQVTRRFLDFIRGEVKMKPVWLLVSEMMMEILVYEFRWRALSCTQEQRSDSDKADPSVVQIAAQKKGVFKVREVEATEEIQKKCDARIKEWSEGRDRKGKQIHLTEVAPWKDTEHRRYFIAQSDHNANEKAENNESGSKKGEQTIDTLVVLARLAPSKGYQLKWALDFPGSPHDAIESTVQAALSAVPGEPVTFGTAVSESLVTKHGIGGLRATFMERTYRSIVKSLSLDKKAGFREKFGVSGDLTYICYPKGGVKLYELKDIVKFFE
ncbi:aspartate-tRNA(Asn) ligase [Cryptococcus gattii EJB2]|uniref:aspartate--tRNA ligase n=1 Tax=Cryptococcus gattii EJB2 TaxID=1296103 RepID=A0ABR5BPA6_9TREE|nr:aspartate-tRNA(Asn) ligase [Cryptococcus gattii EJB2]